jgi:hypothetical protein
MSCEIKPASEVRSKLYEDYEDIDVELSQFECHKNEILNHIDLFGGVWFPMYYGTRQEYLDLIGQFISNGYFVAVNNCPLRGALVNVSVRHKKTNADSKKTNSLLHKVFSFFCNPQTEDIVIKDIADFPICFVNPVIGHYFDPVVFEEHTLRY